MELTLFKFKKYDLRFLAVAAAICLGASGCAQLTSVENKVLGKTQTDLLAVNTAIAKASKSAAAFITSKIVVADGYFQTIAATGVFSQAAIDEEASELAKAEAYLANPPTTISAVATDLAAIFTNIQNLTTVSPTLPVLVPST